MDPSDVTVSEGQYAEFNCSFSCADSHDTTIIWLVGHFPRRSFIMETAPSFAAKTGLHVEVERLLGCNGHDVALERLRINASSAEQFNRTAVQCWVPPLSADTMRLYSPYGVMFINSTGKLVCDSAAIFLKLQNLQVFLHGFASLFRGLLSKWVA